jgi:hypothetical protein
VNVFGTLGDHRVLGGSAYFRSGLIALERGNSEIASSCFQDAADRAASAKDNQP